MDNDEITTVLLALRLLQLHYNEQIESYELPPQLQAYQQENEILDPNEIDSLCEDINMGYLEQIGKGYLYNGV